MNNIDDQVVPPEPADHYILSIEHTYKPAGVLAWWAPDSRGYAWNIDQAGLYTKTEAERIAADSNGNEVAVPCGVALQHAGRYVLISTEKIAGLGAINAWGKRK